MSSVWHKIKQNRIQIIVLLVILAVHLVFVSAKEGYHMDELLSFELANAEYNPWIVPTQPQGRLAKFVQEEIYGDTFGETVQNLVNEVKDVLQNRGSSKLLTYTADVYEEPVWISRDDYEAYISTGQRDSFNLLSVYFNVKDDNHPPVHFMMLHLIASFFPGQISVWMGCLINIASILGICICMMKGGNLLEKHGLVPEGKGKAWGIFASLLYGLSAGAIATTLLIRMYGMMTFFCVWMFYIIVKKWLTGSFDKKNALLIMVVVLGFLTQYFFLFYCIFLAILTFVLLLVKKRKKEAWIFFRSMGISAVIGVGLYPFAISHVFSSGRGVEALNNLMGSLMDYIERLGMFGGIVLQRSFAFTWLGLVLLILGIVYLGYVLIRRKCAYKWLVWMLILPPTGYFLLVAKMAPMYVDRYVMAVFPFLAMMLAVVLTDVASKEKKAFWPIAVSVLALLGGIAIFTYDGEYLYKGYESQVALAEEYKDTSCICVYEGYGFYDNLPEYAIYKETLLITLSELEQRQNREDIENLDEIIVIKKVIVDEEKCLNLLRDYGFELKEVLMDETSHNDRIYLMQKIE